MEKDRHDTHWNSHSKIFHSDQIVHLIPLTQDQIDIMQELMGSLYPSVPDRRLPPFFPFSAEGGVALLFQVVTGFSIEINRGHL